ALDDRLPILARVVKPYFLCSNPTFPLVRGKLELHASEELVGHPSPVGSERLGLGACRSSRGLPRPEWPEVPPPVPAATVWSVFRSASEGSIRRAGASPETSFL